MDICPQCGTPYGKRRRCYQCAGGRKKTGQLITCEREGCGKQRYVQQNQLLNEPCRFCSTRCKKLAMKGNPFPGPQYQPVPLGHRRQRSDGYIEVKVGRDVSSSGYELEHRLLMALLLGRKLERSEEVHHEDLDRSHNCPGNLEMTLNGDHQRMHAMLYPTSTKVPVTCAFPGCTIVKLVKPSSMKTYKNHYCSHEHRLDAMHQKAREYHADNRAHRGYDESWPERPFPGDYGPNWPEQRDACLARDGYHCQRCEGTKDLMAAHIIPRGRFVLDAYEAANALENLVTLCRGCHISFDAEQGIR